MHKANPFQWQPNSKTALTTALEVDQHHCSRRLSDVRKNTVPIGKLSFSHQNTPTLLLFYDIETTGLSTMECAMTQLAVQCVLRSNRHCTAPPTYTVLSQHCSYVHTDEVVSNFITSLTGITQDDVEHAPPFAQLAQALHETIQSHCRTHNVQHCFWIAHNGFRFDQPILSRYLQQLRTSSQCLQSVGDTVRFWCVDTYKLSQVYDYATHHPTHPPPPNHKLPTLYTFFTTLTDTNTTTHQGTPIQSFHRADADVEAMKCVFQAMEANQPDVLFDCVSYDTYFMDKMSPQRMVNKVCFDALQGVHGQTIQWTEQQRAVLGAPFDQHMCIVAGAGCAKTTTLLGRILCLLRSGVPPQRITLVTFSKDATEDMVERLTQWVGTEVPIVTGTFDALARRYLKDNDEVAFDACQDVGDYKHAFLHFLHTSRSPQRQSVLSGVDYLLVDEYQDINSTYHDIIQAFARHGTRITAVGDDAQNIYTWNGSDIQYILEFGATFHTNTNDTNVPVHTYYLTHNFRSTPEIIRLANASIARNTHQLSKTIEATHPSKAVPVTVHVHTSWAQEAQAVMPLLQTALSAGQTVAILCRNCTNNGPLYFYESQCIAHNIPCTLLERYRDHRNQRRTDSVTLCTIHKSKGLEWDVVVVVGCTEGHFPSLPSSTHSSTDTHEKENDVDEERRLFYVATTRAKTQLVFTVSHNVNATNRMQIPISRFLVEVPRSLFVWAGSIPPNALAQPDVHTAEPTQQCVSLEKALSQLSQHQWQALRQALRTTLDGITCESVQVHSAVKVPAWVEHQHAHEDIERWCVHVLARMHNIPILDAFDRLETTLMVSRKEYNVYMLYKNTFDRLCNNTDTCAENIATADLCVFHRLYQRCVEKAEACGVAVSEVQISPRTNLPSAIRQRLVTSYKTYTDATKEWSDVLWEAFEVSWLVALERGRMRMVHQHILGGQDALAECQPLVDKMEEACGGRLAYMRDARSVRVLTTCVADGGVSVDAPLLVERAGGGAKSGDKGGAESKWVLFNVSMAERTQTTSHECVRWMMEAVVCRQSGVCVQAVHTYYPHKGVLNVVDLTSMQSTEQSTDVWALWQQLRTTGETIVVPNPTPVDAEVVVVDTESWESCVVDDVYR